MKELIALRLKQFAAWGTVWKEKYAGDLFFRTTVHVVLLQTSLVVISLVAFWWVLQYTNREILDFIIEHIQEIVLDASSNDPAEVSSYVADIQTRVVWYVFGGVIAVAIGFGVLLARFTLRPARETLRYQKLFISNVAHELRTPLSTIKTSTEVALLDERLPPTQRKTLLSIISELDRVSEIINNLLSLNIFTRPERMQLVDIDLGPIVEEVVQRHTSFANERDVKVLVKLDAHRIVWGNAAGLEQVITNLLKNAISYTPKNTGGVVTLSVHPDYHGMVVLSVTDNGIGIAREDLFHIFEPFYRADTSRARQVRRAGSGLGLTIVNEIVRVHHGRIRIQSAPRKGTTVSVYLQAGTPVELKQETERNLTPSPNSNEVSIDFTKGFNSPHNS